MNKSKIFSCLLLTIVFSILLSNFPHAGKSWGESGGEIKIGVIADQTGPAASVCLPLISGFRIYFSHLNNTGGINGRKVKLIIEDDRYSVPRAIAAFKKLVFKDEVVSTLGMGGTGQTTALFREIEKNKMVSIPLSWSNSMTDPLRKFIFTPGNDNKDEINIIMEYIVSITKGKNPRFAVISPDVEFGKSGARIMEAKAKELNLKIVGQEILDMGSIDASTQMLSLRRAQASHIIVIEPNPGIVAVLRAAKRLNYFPDYYGTFHAFGDEVAGTTDGIAENMYGAAAFGSWFDDSEGISEIRKIVLLHDPKITSVHRYFIKAWITSNIITEGIKRAGKNCYGDSLVNALETIKNLDMKGITGPISYSSKNHKGNNYARIYKADVRKGYFTPVTDWIKTEK